MKIIDFNHIVEANISPLTCYEWVSEMIFKKSEAILPPKISMKPVPSVFCNVMPSIISKIGGVKIVTRYPDRSPSLDSILTLFNAETGEMLATMDANWITAMRTGAVAAHSISLLAKSDFQTIGMVGLGNTARAALLVLAELFPEKHLNIKLLRHKGQEEVFKQRFSKYSNLEFSFVDSPERLVGGSEVIISAATYMPQDLCADKYYDHGVLVVPIHTLGFTNCDLFFDKVFADDYGHVHHFKNFDKFKYFAEISDVVNKKTVGRQNDDERILAYNIGISLHDVNFAAHIYDLLKNDDSLPEIELNSPKEKFWI